MRVTMGQQAWGDCGFWIDDCGLNTTPNTDGTVASSNPQATIRNPQSSGHVVGIDISRVKIF